MKDYLLFPFRGASLVLVITFTLGFWLAEQAGLMGLPLLLLLISWLFKYAYVLLDAIVTGAEEPPVLSIEMVNPLNEQRPLAQVLLIVVGAALTFELSRVWLPLGVLVGSVLLLALPASIAVLGLSGNIFYAAWPPQLWSLMRAMGGGYVLLLGSILAVIMVESVLVRLRIPSMLGVAAGQWGLLLIFTMAGAALREYRLVLGIEYRSPRERLEDRAQREHDSERAKVLDRAHDKFRVKKPQEGWREIQGWLNLHGGAADLGNKVLPEYRAMLRAAARWDDGRAADKLTDELLTLYFQRHETGRALDVLEERLATNPNYRPGQPGHAVRLAELAAAAGKRGLRRVLVPETKDS